jgi:hypothetical protein
LNRHGDDESEAAWGAIKEACRQQKAQHKADMKANKAKIAQIAVYEAVDKHYAAHFVGAAGTVMGRHRIEATHGANGTRMFAAAWTAHKQERERPKWSRMTS